MDIAKIICRQLAGEALTAEERQALDRWLGESGRRREMLADFGKEGYWQREESAHQAWSADEGLERFRSVRSKMQRRCLWRVVGGVAAVAVVLISGALFLQREKEEIALNPAAVQAGSGRAMLVLSDGRNVTLSDSTATDFREHESVVNVNGKSVSYSAVDTGETVSYNVMCTPCGGEFMLHLADGTRVWLNADTKLKFPVSFRGKYREVELEGEAFFEVERDSLHPFVVRSGEVSLEVLGTSFSMTAYRGEPFSAVLAEGSVSVTAGEESQVLKPGEKLLFKNGRMSVDPVNVDLHTAWRDRSFGFENAPLEEVVRMLERWYDIDFLIMDTEVRTLRFTGKLPKYNNLDKILEILQLTTNIRFVVRTGRIEVCSE